MENIFLVQENLEKSGNFVLANAQQPWSAFEEALFKKVFKMR